MERRQLIRGWRLAGLGVTSLSMAPSAIAEVRAALAAHTMEQCRELARAALQ